MKTGLTNKIKKTHILFNDFIRSCLDIHYTSTVMHEVFILFNGIFNTCLIIKGRWYEIEKLPMELKAHWSFPITCDVTCLETYKNIKTIHFNKTWINLIYVHRFLDFASTRVLLKTCPALSWDQDLLSFSWVNRFQAEKGNRKVSHLVQFLFTCACESNVMIVASLAQCAFT